jgi:uncharacterized protein (DUF362 family)
LAAPSKTVVVLEKSQGHLEGTLKALRLVEADIAKGLDGKKRVIVKPNFVSTTKQLAVTPVDSVKAILQIITKHYDGEITLGEGSASGPLEDAINNFGYAPLIEEYGLKVIDFNKDKSIELEGVDSNLAPLKFNVSKTLHDCDYLVSAAVPKTHDTVVATLSIKNIVVGSLVTVSEKQKIHQGFKAINLNIARFIRQRMPDLGVLDGFIGMEGEGPEDGTPVPLHVAAASVNPVSLDAVMAKVMGFEPMDIGYLHHLDEWGVGIARLNEITVIGQPISEVAVKFKPHSTYRDQLNWK